jgi:hypothetical protein
MRIHRRFIVCTVLSAMAAGAGCEASTERTGNRSDHVDVDASACFPSTTCECDSDQCTDGASCPADGTCATCQDEQDDVALYGDPRDYADPDEQRLIDWERGVATLDGTPIPPDDDGTDAGEPEAAPPVLNMGVSTLDYAPPTGDPPASVPVGDQPDWLKKMIAKCNIGGKFPYCDKDHSKENPDYLPPRIPNATFNCADFTYVFNTCGQHEQPNMKWFRVATDCKPRAGGGDKARHALSLVCDGIFCFLIEPQWGDASTVRCSFQRGRDENPPKIPDRCRDAACPGSMYAIHDPEVSEGAGGNNGYLCHGWFERGSTKGAVNACRAKMSGIGIDPDTCFSTR